MSAQLRPDHAEIRRALDLLCKPGEVYEVRGLKTTKRTVTCYSDDLGKLAGVAAQICGGLVAEGVYITLNPCLRDAMARSANELKYFAQITTGDDEITGRRWMMIDLDPRRSRGISSTHSEHELALERAHTIRESLTAIGFPLPVIVDSGNGAHLWYRVELANDDLSRELLKSCLTALDRLFSDGRVEVDRANFNAARIVKLPGTVARKGSDTADRPHRLAKIIEVPSTLAVVTRDQLRGLGAFAKAEGTKHEGTKTARGRSNSINSSPGTTSW